MKKEIDFENKLKDAHEHTLLLEQLEEEQNEIRN